MTVSCPALFIAAPASGEGKTTITAALARLHARSGKVVRVFKTGPDYLDPQVLAKASGQAVLQLDLWMAGADYCRQKLYEAATVADLILIEGAMGLFDGEPSSADLAALFGIPVALVMDVKGMAQTAAAVATGLANYRDDFRVYGLIANNCGSERHRELIQSALPDDLPLLASFKRDEAVALPERHLGLVQPDEVRPDELEQRFDVGADCFIGTALAELPPALEFNLPSLPLTLKPSVTQLLSGVSIGIANDAAFSFIYQANLDLLAAMGANIVNFSPLNDATLPAVDALWLPGGYPELHAEALANNIAMKEAIKHFAQAQKPILAECGGFLYCLDTLSDLEGRTHTMLGILNGDGAMRGKRGCQGMQTAPLLEGEVRGHAHHRSRSDMGLKPYSHGRRQRHTAPGEAIYREAGITASYLHLFFPSNPEAVAALFLQPKNTINQKLAGDTCSKPRSVSRSTERQKA